MIPKPTTLDFTEPPKREVPSFLTTSNDTRPSVASIAPPVHVVKQRRRLQSRKVNRENLPQPGPDDESGEPQPAIELEQPSEEEMAPFAHLRSSVGDKPVWMLLSKHWSFRQELCDFLAQSLHQLGQQKYRPSLLSVVEAVLEALVVLLQDSVYNVYARAVNILEEVTALTLSWGTSAWPVVARSSILNILANRLLDGQARVRNTASKSLLRIAAQQVQGTDLHVCNSVVKAISNLEGANTTGSTVHASGVLTKVALLVTIMEQHCALLDDDDDDGVKCTLEYAIRNLEHPNGKVRRASSELIVVLLKQQPDPKIFLDQYHAQLNMFTVEKLKDEGLGGVGTSRDERIVNAAVDITSCPPAVQKIMQACPNFTKVPLSLLTARDWKQRRHFFTLLFEDLQQNDAPLSSTSREEEEIYLKLSQIGLEDPVPFVVASAQTSVVALLRRIENQKATDILLNSLMRSLLRDLASSQERRVAAVETLVKELIAKSKLKTSTLLEIISDDEPLRAGKEVSAQRTKYWKTRCVAFRVLGMIISVRTVKKLTLEEVGGIVAACHHGLASSHPQTRCASCNVAAELIHQGCPIDQFTLGDPQISRILETHLRSVNQGVSATNKSFTNQRLESMVVNLTLDESKDVPNIPEVHAGARMEVPTIKDRILQGNTQADAKVTLNADRPVMRNSKASTGRLIFN